MPFRNIKGSIWGLLCLLKLIKVDFSRENLILYFLLHLLTTSRRGVRSSSSWWPSLEWMLLSMSSVNMKVSPGDFSVGKSSIITENKKGLSGDPWGTPTLSGRSSDRVLPILTLYVWLRRKLFSQPVMLPFTPLVLSL